jgi:hypothetical protein
VTEKAFRDT